MRNEILDIPNIISCNKCGRKPVVVERVFPYGCNDIRHRIDVICGGPEYKWPPLCCSESSMVDGRHGSKQVRAARDLVVDNWNNRMSSARNL